jgi:hypothetical protein
MPSNWSRKLSEPVKLKDGRILETLREVRDLILRLGSSHQKHPWWTYTAELLLKAAESGKRTDIKLATDQLCRVLMRGGMLAKIRVQ